MRCRWTDGQASGHSVNLSATGVLVALDRLPAVSTEVTVEFRLPGRPEPLVLAGSVVRITPGPAPLAEGPQVAEHSVGIKFDHKKRELRLLLAEFVEKTLAAQPPALPTNRGLFPGQGTA